LAEPAGARRAAWNQGCWSEVYAQAAAVRLAHEVAEVAPAAVVGVDVAVVGDVVAVVAQRRRVERQQPEGVHPQVLDVVEAAGEPFEIAGAIVVGVEERLDVELVDDGVLVPERIALGILFAGLRHTLRSLLGSVLSSRWTRRV